MNEKELVLRARQGDDDSFCTLYSLYKSKLYSYAYYKLGNADDAEDAVQICAMTAFEEIKSLRKPEAFSSWVFRILYCCCADLIKQQSRRRGEDDIDSLIGMAGSDFENVYLSNELRDALGRLKEDERSIVLLSVVAGLKSKEIGKIMDATAGSVRQKLSRSLHKMREYLE